MKPFHVIVTVLPLTLTVAKVVVHSTLSLCMNFGFLQGECGSDYLFSLVTIRFHLLFVMMALACGRLKHELEVMHKAHRQFFI